MRKKRFAALMLAMSMALPVFLTGCGDTDSQSTNGNSTSVSSETGVKSSEEAVPSEDMTKELDPVTLKFWLPTDKTEESDLVLEQVNEYLEEVLPNTTLEIEWVPMAEYKDRWGKAMASREVVDLSWFGYANNSLESEVANGALMPIDDLVKEYGSGILDTLGEDCVEIHRSSDGNLYFLPSWQGIVGNRFALFVPHDIVELMGEGWGEKFQDALYENWETPFWDVESKMVFATYVEEMLATAKDANMLNLGFYIRQNPVKFYFLSNSLHRNGRKGSVPIEINAYLEGDTFYVQANSALDSPEYYQTQVYHDWYKKGYIREDVLSVALGDVSWKKDLVREQTYVNYTHNGWSDNAHDTYSAKAGYQIDGFYFQESTELSNGLSSGVVIPSTSANPERAMMLLELIYTDDALYHLLIHGIEGTHYTKNNDGTISYVENVKYTGPQNWILGTCMNSLPTAVADINKYQDLKDAEKIARTSPLEGFTFVEEPVAVEIANVNAVTKEYTSQSMFVLDDWETAYKARRDKMIAAGIEAVLNEYCAQLTEFAAEKGLKVVNMGY